MIIKNIANDLRLPVDFILKVAVTAGHRYKRYRIKKRTGGYRNIEHPARELKLIQHWVIDNVLSNLPIHESVYSYRKGRNIRQNAERHRRNKYLLRVDFSDFFPSIKAEDILILLAMHQDKSNYPLSKTDLKVIASIVCRRGALTIGAPSSPVISNAILFDLDTKLFNLASELSITYTRYADDLFFSTSTPNSLDSFFEKAKDIVSTNYSPKLKINHKKTIFTSSKRRKIVTGLTLTPDKKISIGRKLKRKIRSLVYKFGKGQLGLKEAVSLQGMLSYVRDIEPSFFESLERKYGPNLLSSIRRSVPSNSD